MPNGGTKSLRTRVDGVQRWHFVGLSSENIAIGPCGTPVCSIRQFSTLCEHHVNGAGEATRQAGRFGAIMASLTVKQFEAKWRRVG